MRFDNEGRSEDIEDRRGRAAPRGAVGGGIGIGGIVLVLAVSALTGRNPLEILRLVNGVQTQQGSQPSPGSAPGAPRNAEEARSEQLVRRATTDIQDYWTQALPQQGGKPFERTRLVMFTDATRSGCGAAEADMGPFYCPADHLVYIDLGFYGELERRFAAPGDFAQAYVLAHEFGHHIQNTLGIEARVRRAQRANPAADNALSVAMELQADCLAGVWGGGASTRGLLEAGDVEEGLRAAASIGDDRIQRMAGRRVNPESFTHGSSEQRVQWFRRGMEARNLTACATFDGAMAP